MSNRRRQPFSPDNIPKGPRIRGAAAVPGAYCAVGCNQLAYVKNGRVLDIEGNPDSRINERTLCTKGGSTFQLVYNGHRITSVLYRAPFSERRETRPLEWAMASALTVAGAHALKWAIVHAGRDSADDPRAAMNAAAPVRGGSFWQNG